MRLFNRGDLTSGVLWMPEWAIERIMADADLYYPDETGSAFIGYEIDDGLVITEIVDAGPMARRTTTTFVPDEKYQLQEIARAYERSGRTQTYIGDWHSHPGSSPAYSIKDKQALRIVATSPRSHCARPMMLILGDGDPWSAVAWRYRPGQLWDSVEPMAIRRF